MITYFINSSFFVIPQRALGSVQIIIFSLCLLFSKNPIFSQTIISSTDFLKTATSDKSLIHENETINFLKNTPHDLPALEELEFRTETDEFRWGRQEYTMRFRLNTEKERFHHNNFHQTNIEVAERGKEVLWQKKLMDHYEILLDYYEIQNDEFYKKQQQLVLEDKLKVMRKLVQLSTDFNLNDLIDTEDELHEIERDLLEIAGKKRRLNLVFQRALNLANEIEIDTSNLISIEKIRSLTNNISDTINTHPALDFRQARLAQTAAEYELEIAEDFQFLDFMQVKYSGRDDLGFGRELSVGLGLKIPLKKANQVNLNELKLEKIEDENRLEGLQFKLSNDIFSKKQSLNLLFQQYDLVTKQFANSQLSYSLDNFQQLANEKPLTILRIKESQIRRQKSLSDIENNIRDTFLELIELTGKISSSPTLNWLSEDLDVVNFKF